eukprot:TRINITY_DN40221_c0_g1_i1.p1 TRINITY_DN40221_c0_g1~~TRINITY_DN40221_c0_g1_i1.p1  ORF type:complete len:213 (+),score=35.03 TRINITY_DN40221_c0_g1_i1:35-640(+)
MSFGRYMAVLPSALAGVGTWGVFSVVRDVVTDVELTEALVEAEKRMERAEKLQDDWVDRPGDWVSMSLPIVPVVASMAVTWGTLSRRYGGREKAFELFHGRHIPKSVLFRPALTTTIGTLLITSASLTLNGFSATINGRNVPTETALVTAGTLFSSSLFTIGFVIFPYYVLCNIVGAAVCRQSLVSMGSRIASKASRKFGS